MKLYKLVIITIVLVFFTFISCKSLKATKEVVKNVSEFNNAVLNAKPGSTITLANGIWNDAELIFKGNGTKQNPITLTVEDNGQVNLTGLSCLKISGGVPWPC